VKKRLSTECEDETLWQVYQLERARPHGGCGDRTDHYRSKVASAAVPFLILATCPLSTLFRAGGLVAKRRREKNPRRREARWVELQPLQPSLPLTTPHVKPLLCSPEEGRTFRHKEC
jgi:hypothetical protein